MTKNTKDHDCTADKEFMRMERRSLEAVIGSALLVCKICGKFWERSYDADFGPVYSKLWDLEDVIACVRDGYTMFDRRDDLIGVPPFDKIVNHE